MTPSGYTLFRTRSGEKLTDFTDGYVHEVIEAISCGVDHGEQERVKDLPFYKPIVSEAARLK